jgi:hypothetical protein
MADPHGADDRLVFRNYARAHRHGSVVGQLPGGVMIPFGPYSLTQVGVFVVALIVLYVARGLWMHLGWLPDGVVLFGVPYGLALCERFVRPEQRSPLRTVAALAEYATAPRGGRRRGRPLPRRRPRPPRPLQRRARIFLQDLPLPAAASQRRGTQNSTGPRPQTVAPLAPPLAVGPPAPPRPPQRVAESPVASLADLLPAPSAASGRLGGRR